MEIDWKASYATKPGFPDDKEFYENIFILSQKNDPDNRKVRGILTVNETFHHNLNYERYEIIYLAINVTDINQTIGENKASAMLTIFIEDENDNPPEFILNTLQAARNVIEQAADDSVIGTILARDVDGPGNNIIEYSLE